MNKFKESITEGSRPPSWVIRANPVFRAYYGIDKQGAVSVVPQKSYRDRLTTARALGDSTSRRIIDILMTDDGMPKDMRSFLRQDGDGFVQAPDVVALMKLAAADFLVWNDRSGVTAISPKGWLVMKNKPSILD